MEHCASLLAFILKYLFIYLNFIMQGSLKYEMEFSTDGRSSSFLMDKI